MSSSFSNVYHRPLWVGLNFDRANETASFIGIPNLPVTVTVFTFIFISTYMNMYPH